LVATVGPNVGAAPAGEGLQLPAPAPKVGDKVTEVETMGMKMSIETAPGKTADIVQAKHHETIKEVLAVDGGVITKIKLTYKDKKETQSAGGKLKDEVVPTVGKTYVVWREGDVVKATAEDGSAPPKAELEEVLDDNKNLGRPAALEMVLATKRFKVGERVELTAEELATINTAKGSGPGDPAASAMVFTLTGVEGTTASFTMSMTMGLKGPKGDMEISLAGTASVDTATGRPLSLVGAGPLKGNMGAPVTGTMNAETVYTY